MIITLQTLIFFRESLLNALDRLLRPYYKKFSLVFGRNGEVSEDEEPEEQVFAEYDDERGVVFYPPMYVQRYAAVSDCLMDERWCGKLEKVVDIGYHDMSFIKYLKEVPGVKRILGVDIESIPLRCSSDLIACDDYIPKRENPLQITLFKGNAADPDYRLIGCDAVVAIEMIEHMLPHDLDRLIHTVFGFIKPMIAVFTTPNGDFNVLFKALEKNGLRRLDHFFEWSREQFHDWCSNIILRYPDYTVSCKGIGPGPHGTKHLGCCSQMALFIAKDYHKQQDLNLNSLALVSNSPSPDSISNLISSWSTEFPAIEPKQNSLQSLNNIESLAELYSEKQSCITIVPTSQTYSSDSLLYLDKTSQCNLDTEISRNYLMFDYEQMCFDLVEPRRKTDFRVYTIEDVNSRLNCSTFQVKKFSKTTQNMMAKNKLDSLVHTREVVDEIRHLTKMLNFDRDSLKQLPDSSATTWNNINWGENAPYWNQYYKIVREYNYPFESKSDECRILELISDEINRLIDMQYDDELSTDMNKLEIPIQYLMNVVEHITDDVDKVKDLLEWNGYEVSGDTVIHSRLLIDNASVATQDEDSQETDTFSDWDSTDMRSTSLSDGSTIVPDTHARCLRRALDHKVRKLRSMLTADEDITTELDQVVCRLMKLALKTSKGRRYPPPTRWMQCKLLDLLTLTEKSIERRKRHFVERYSLKALTYGEKTDELVVMEKIIKDDTARRIVDKYKHLVKQSDDSEAKYHYIDFELEENLSISSNGFDKDYALIDRSSPSLLEYDIDTLKDTEFHAIELAPKLETSLERTQAWVEEDIEVVSYPDHDANFDKSSGNTDHSITKITKSNKNKTQDKPCIEVKCVVCKRSHSKTFNHNIHEKKSKEKCSKTKLVKKVSRKKSSINNLGKTTCNKYASADSKAYKLKPRRKHYKTLYPTASKPIPNSLIELCHPELMTDNVIAPYSDNFSHVISNKVNQDKVLKQGKSEIAATKQSLLIGIVTDEVEETVALRRTIGTDPDEVELLPYEEETLIRSVSNTDMNEEGFLEKNNVTTENVHSQTIFLYDIDEPTTSKGIRHVSMDVQCGPDSSIPTYSMLSATTSLTRMPKMFTAAIKIGDSTTDTKVKNTDCSTCTETHFSYKTIVPRENLVGIKIKDSNTMIPQQKDDFQFIDHKIIDVECGSSTNNINYQFNTILPKEKKSGISVKNTEINNSMETAGWHDMTDTSKNIDCGTCTRNIFVSYEFTQKSKLVDLKLKDFDPDIPKQSDGFHSPSMSMKNYGCGTSFNESQVNANPILGNETSHDLKIKKSDLNITDQMEYYKNTSRLCDRSHESPPTQTSHSETQLLTSIPSGLKVEDSVSDLGVGSFVPYNKIASDLANNSKNSKLQNVTPDRTNKNSEKFNPKYVKRRLCHGGIQVHSFRDKKSSEDIVYQGEWQKNRPKVLTKRKIFNSFIPKKISESNVKKTPIIHEKVARNNVIKRDLRSDRKPLPARCNNKLPNNEASHKINEVRRIRKSSLPTGVTPTVNKPFRHVSKVPSNMMSSLPSKNAKSAFVVKKPSLISNLTITKDVEVRSRIINKNYIPLYLRRRTLKSANDVKNINLNVSLDSAKSNAGKEKVNRGLVRSKTEEIKRDVPKFRSKIPKTVQIKSDLLKFQAKTPFPNYVVLRNDIEKKNSNIDKQQIKDNVDDVQKRDTGKQRQVSPTSANSSTCSSPNSIATVRAVSVRTRNLTKRKHSASFYKINTAKSESESTTPDRIKKVTKRCKSAKPPTEKLSENKENIPETSKQNNIGKKSDKFAKSTFMGQKKDVYVAQLKESPPLQSNTLSRNKAQKSSVNIPRATRSQSPSVSKRVSIKSDISEPIENVSKNSQTSDIVLVIDPQTRELVNYVGSNQFDTTNFASNLSVTNWIDSYHEGSGSTMVAMRQLIDEALDFIDEPFDYNSIIDSETVILSRENQQMEINSSPISFNTVIANTGNYDHLFQHDIEHALNRSFETTLGDESVISFNDTRLTVTDFDMLSFKSVTSTSRLSEYLSADNELSGSQLKLVPTVAPNRTTVRDIFERKDSPVCSQNPPAALAIQAFSGFSLDGEPIPGDQQDPINPMDSETGSFAVDVNRQATSEELFISGRSSDSFESCLLDEDAVVPNWLFQIISQQQSAMDELEPPVQLMVPLPLAEPMYDGNGNVVEAPGAGAGAGDGHGIHSDHSQDSSGRGTSVSSSETSSGPHSESVLMDPSAFVAQFELLRDAIDGSGVMLAASEPSESLEVAMASRPGGIESSSDSLNRGESRRVRRVQIAGSDVDADVSSLDTDDVPDSSDN